MPGTHRIVAGEQDGFATRELVSPAGLAATWVPAAGMVCSSLRHRDGELLGRRKGLAAYARAGSTMGIPLLHPWANRLARRGYALGDTRVEFPPDAPLVHPDPNGLPIHGLLGGFAHWRVVETRADASAARLRAEVDLGARTEVMALFPFPHVLGMEVVLSGSVLRVDTRLHATGDVPVPVAFGYHPYFRLPGVPRERWEVELPVRRRARLDARFLPTGESEPARVAPGALGDRVFDDLYLELAPDPVFVLAGGGRRVEVAFGDAFRVGVVYAPADDDVICFEPMTAPTNPFEGGWKLAWVAPGEVFSAGFSIRVT